MAAHVRPIAYASDLFTRTLTNTWGTATTGGAWSFTPTGNIADFDATGTAGHDHPHRRRRQPLGAPRRRLGSPTSTLSFRVATDKAAAGGNQYVYGIARRTVSATNSYRAKLRFAPTAPCSSRPARS